jgi:hypothetical protein
MLTANSTAIIATATRLAEPRSAQTRLHRGHRLSSDGDARQQCRSRRDGGDDEFPVVTQLHRGAVRCDAPRRIGCRTVAAGGKPRRLTRGVDTAHLHRHRHEPGHAQDEHNHQGSDRKRRLDGDATVLIT